MLEPRKEHKCGICKYNRYIAGYKRQEVKEGFTSPISRKLVREVEYMDGHWQCCNVDSDNLGLETSFNDPGCADWEDKDEE